MGAIHQPSAAFSMPAVARILSQFERAQLAGFIEVALGLLDIADGDPDLEDSEATNPLVDATGRFRGYVPEGQDEDREPEDDATDFAWIERIDQSQPSMVLATGDAGRRWNSCAAREDDEDDDPAGDPLDAGEMGDRPLYKTLPVYGVDQSQGPTNEEAAHRAHVEAMMWGRP